MSSQMRTMDPENVFKDCPFKPNGTVSFEIDTDNADRFQILPPINFTRKVCEDSMTYAPRISLKRRLSAAEGDISFFLIAKVSFKILMFLS